MVHPARPAPGPLVAGFLPTAVFIFILFIAGPTLVWAQSAAGEQVLVLQRGAETVAVVRGQDSDALPSGVAVVRGPAIVRQAASGGAEDRDNKRRPRLRAVAGDSIWLVDRASGELISCYLVDGPDYGEAEIRCWKRGLPY